MKDFLRNPMKICISIACIVVAVYFAVLTYKQLKPQTYQEQRMHCLELGSNARATACLRLIRK